MNVGSIAFFDSMLQYYFAGLDVSSLSDEQYATKVAHLSVIRKMEGDSTMQKALKSILGE